MATVGFNGLTGAAFESRMATRSPDSSNAMGEARLSLLPYEKFH
jgi:hypothetical protein